MTEQNIRGFRTLLLSLAALCAAAGCSKTKDPASDDVEDRALEAWIAANAPDAAELSGDGIYYQVLESVPEQGPKMEVRGRWVKLEYTMRDLEGNIFYNRDEETARRLGTYNAYTHYVPDFIYIASEESATNLPIGFYRAIVGMNPGDTWRVYLPSRLSFSGGLDLRNGYGGQKPLAAKVPVMIDSLRIVDIVEDPEMFGQQQIEDMAVNDWGMARNDTLRRGMYMQVLERRNPDAEIAQNESADIYYKVSFLDGQLITSNMEEVLEECFGSVRSGYDNTHPISVTRMESTPTNRSQMPAKVFYEFIGDLRYGDHLRVAVPARYAYYDAYMRPNKSESSWQTTATFTVYTSFVDYANYTTSARDYKLGASTFYYPSSLGSTVVPVAEIKPYTPLVYELWVYRKED